MALSKELKAYINKKYDEKIADVEKARRKALTEAIEEFDKVNMTTREMETFDLVESLQVAIQNLIDNHKFTPTYDGKDFLRNGVRELINLPHFNADSINKECGESKKIIEREREKLLILLSLEKDFDRINKILSEYGVSI